MKLTPEFIKIKGERVLRSCKTDLQLDMANNYITRMYMNFMGTTSKDKVEWFFNYSKEYSKIKHIIKLFKVITFQVHSNLNNVIVQEISYDDLDNLGWDDDCERIPKVRM